MKTPFSKEARIGLLAIVSLSMLYFGFNFLKGKGFFSQNYTYYIAYDNTSGLIASNPVTIHGVVVGMVTDIRLTPDRSKAIVSIEVSKRVGIPKGSLAFLKESGLLGGMQIELQLSNQDDYHRNGDTLVSAKEDGMFAAVEKQAKPIIEKLDSTLVLINSLLKDLNGVGAASRQTLQSLSGSAEQLELTLQESRPLLRQNLQQLSQLSANLSRASNDLPAITSKLNSLTDSLHQARLHEAIAQAQQTLVRLQQLLAQANEPSGTVGAMLHDRALYQNLVELSADLDKLLIDLRRNPRRYIKISVF